MTGVSKCHGIVEQEALHRMQMTQGCGMSEPKTLKMTRRGGLVQYYGMRKH